MAMNSNQENPQGVGGWLAFLIAGMLVIGPLLSIARVTTEFGMTEMQFPVLLESAEWLSFKRAEWIAVLIFSAISIYGGFGLWKKRTPDVVAKAKLVLWFNYPISVAATSIIIPAMMMPMAKDDIAKAVFTLLASLIGVGIWTAYLNRSKRVRNTYGGVGSALTTHEQTTTNELPDISNPAITSGRERNARTQEQLWSDALTEFESASKRPGLWAKSFAEAGGNDAVAKANYLRYRVEELELEAKSRSDEVRRKKTAPATAIAGSSSVIPVNVDALPGVQNSWADKYAWVLALLVVSSVVIFFALDKVNPVAKPVAGVSALAVADSNILAAQPVKPQPIDLKTFDWNKARADGFTNEQILDGLQSGGKLPFDYNEAKKQGFTATDIANYYNPPKKVDIPAVADGKPVFTPTPKLASPDVKTFQWDKAYAAGYTNDQILKDMNDRGALPDGFYAEAKRFGYTADQMAAHLNPSKKLNEKAVTKGDKIRVTPQEPKIDPEVLKQEAEAQKLQAQVAQTARDAQAISDAHMMLKLEFPKWMEDVNSRNFTTWIENEPLEIQALMNSKSVEDARSLMKRFYGRNKK
jgi:hypothetical protein